MSDTIIIAQQPRFAQVSLTDVNEFLHLVCANKEAAFVQVEWQDYQGNTNHGKIQEQHIPIGKHTWASFQDSSVHIRPNYCHYEKLDTQAEKQARIANGATAICLEIDKRPYKDEQGNDIVVPLHEQLEVVRRAGIPVSFAFYTGGKSIHFWVAIAPKTLGGVRSPVTQAEFRNIAYGLKCIIEEVSQGEVEVDAACMDIAHAFRLPGSLHAKSGNNGQKVIGVGSGEAFAPDILSEWSRCAPVAVAKQRQNKYNVSITVEGLEADLEQYLRKFTKLRDDLETKLSALCKKELDATVRGEGTTGASGYVFGVARRYAALVTSMGVEKAVAWFIDNLTPVLDSQNETRGKEWDRDEVKLAIVRGLSAGLGEMRTEAETDSRELDGQKMNEPYVSELMKVANKRLTFIRSNTGTGKTYGLRQEIRDKYADKRVLVIGHRVALLEGNSWKAELPEFRVYSEFDRSNLANVNKLLITVDSLKRMVNVGLGKKTNVNYDLIILDEVDQLMQHLFLSLGTEVKHDRKKTVQILKALLQNAGRVIATSAHLSNLEVNIVKTLSGSEDAEVMVNTAQTNPRHFMFLDSQEEAIGKAVESIESDEPPFICCDRKDTAHKIHQLLLSRFPNKKGVVIASDTIADNAAMMQNLAAFVEQLDWLVCSPSLGTGYDINNRHFFTVIGVFTNDRDLGFLDLEQALARVRYPISNTCFVYVCPKTNRQPTEKEFLRKLWRTGDLALESISNFDFSSDGLLVQDSLSEQIQSWQEDYLSRRVEETILRQVKLMSALEQRGHSVERRQLSRKETLDSSSYKEVNVDDIYAAADISFDEWQRLGERYRNGEPLTKYEWASFTRFKVSRCLNFADLTRDDVEWYVEGKGEQQERFARLIAMTQKQAEAADLHEMRDSGTNGGYGASFFSKNRATAIGLNKLVQEVLKLDSFHQSTPEVQKVQEYAVANVGALKQMGIVVNSTRPMTTVNNVLGMMLLSTTKIQVRTGAKREWHFSIADAPELERRYKLLTRQLRSEQMSAHALPEFQQEEGYF